ncbi:MAG TPA: AAA family ATPase [Candidatus Limnocylindria bacterium]
MLATRTFLFSDLRDYTRFVEQHGDTAAASLIGDYRRIVRAELARHEGGEVKTEGDSFYVVFNTTGSAVTCAAAILREAESYSRQHPDRQMRIGMGIHAGEPVPHEGQYVGSAVIVAARLAQSSQAGELLVTEVVRQLLPRSLTLPMEERTGLVLKGLDAPPRVFAVDWRAARATATARSAGPIDAAFAAASPSSQQVLSPVVIGRDRELDTLEEQLVAAIAGRGRAVLVSGEAGLGKSALLRRFVERARARGTRVLIGECTEIEARRPFGPFIDAFLSADLPLPPELAQGGPGALPVAEVERYRVHLAFAERLADAARDQPIVAIIEDLHWADEATNELVPYLARKLRDARVLLLLTYRSDELHRLHPLNHVLAELGRGRLADDVRLKRLTLEEVGEVIKAALALAGSPTAEFRQTLFEHTEGNPFFVEEVLRALVEQGELEYRDGAWHRTKAVAELTIPASVRDAVQQRLLGLEPRARKAMHIAAVIGQHFDFEVLIAVSGLDETALLETIKAAIDAQLVREETDAEGNETYAFRHALSREAVLAELLQRERRQLHRAVGEAIERLAGSAPGVRAEELAYHFDEARESARANRYHGLAAERSLRMAAPLGAIRHLERAIELAPDDDPTLVTLLLRLADIALTVADTQRALRAVEHARALAEERGDVLAAGEAIRRIAQCRWYLGETAQAMEIARSGVALLEPMGPSAPLAACYAELARLAMIDNRDEAVELGERAAVMARQVGARETEINAMNTVGSALSIGRHQMAEGIAVLRRGYAMAEEHGFPMEAGRALNNILAALSTSDAGFSEMQKIHVESLAHAKKHGQRDDALLSRDVLYKFLGGEWDTALRVAAESRTEGIWNAGRDQNVATMLVAREGPLPEHLALTAEATRQLIAAGDRQWVAVATVASTTYYMAERWADAATAAEPGRKLIADGYDIGPVIQTAIVAARTVRLLGDRAAEARWAETLLALEHTNARAVSGLLFARATAARQAGTPEEAHHLLSQGIASLEDRPEPFSKVVLRQELIELLAEAGRLDEAAEAFSALTEYWRRAKATWYLGRLEAWARGLGVATGAG